MRTGVEIGRPSPALVISCLALFVALSGSALALSKGEVKSKHIAKGAVKTVQIAQSAVKSGHVADGAITEAKLAEGILGRPGRPIGPAGGHLAGEYPDPILAPGSVGMNELADDAVDGSNVADESLTGDDIDEATLIDVVTSTVVKRESALSAGTPLNDGTHAIERDCNNDEVLLSGGAANIDPTTTLLESFPTPGTTNSWRARVNKHGSSDIFSVVVLCAKR